VGIAEKIFKIRGQGNGEGYPSTYGRPSVRCPCSGGIPIDGVASILTCFLSVMWSPGLSCGLGFPGRGQEVGIGDNTVSH